MTDVSPAFLDPELVERVSNLELFARQIVEGSISGRHRSPFRGHSVEFAQHRQYAVGDEPRHIDWKVWAKSDRLYIKQFEEETNLRATLLLDVSASMNYGEGSLNKYDFACRLAATIAYLLLRQSDSVGLTTFDEEIRSQTPHRNPLSHFRTIARAMFASRPAHKTTMDQSLARVADNDPKPGLMILVSDLLAQRASVLRGLRLLRKRRHDVIVLHVLHSDELEFPFEGTTRFQGMEEGGDLVCNPRALREDYLKAVEKYRREIAFCCRREGIDYRFLLTSDRIDTVMAELLHERARR